MEEELRATVAAALTGNEAMLEEYALEEWQRELARGLAEMDRETRTVSLFVIDEE